jgi:hypothetical protein
MMELISPDSLELLRNTLVNLIAEQSVYISDVDFKKLTGHEIAEFGSEGRLMIGNLAAATNCTTDTTSGTAVFTKRLARPTAGVWTTLSKQRAHADQSDPAKLSGGCFFN